MKKLEKDKEIIVLRYQKREQKKKETNHLKMKATNLMHHLMEFLK